MLIQHKPTGSDSWWWLGEIMALYWKILLMNIFGAKIEEITGA